jgi:hypothetical protein
VTDQVSHPYKTTGKIMVQCILIFYNADGPANPHFTRRSYQTS